MKYIIFLTSLFLFIASIIATPIYSQTIFPVNEKGQILYTGIVKMDSIDSKELYVRAHVWFANTFKSAKSVIQLDDKEAGRILGKGFFETGLAKSHAGIIHLPIVVSVHFTLEVQTKDGKYKYDFSNFSCLRNEGTQYEAIYDLFSDSFVKNGVWQEKLDEDWLEIRQNINTRMLNIIADLNKSMITNTSNW